MKMMSGKTVGFIEGKKVHDKGKESDWGFKEFTRADYIQAYYSHDEEALARYEYIIALRDIERYETAPPEFNEKIIGYSDAVMQNALRNIDFVELYRALLGANRAALEKIIGQLSRRAGNIVLEDILQAIRVIDGDISYMFGSDLGVEIQQLAKVKIVAARQKLLDLLASEAERES
ncbi:hypothetical protein NO2_0134 [Candidatus Termititenax persephonae]|uniref:Flagellar motor switch protein FliG C-terminal domain-containing protein n=1 Tax=Candidatus Termititenax persephonae TaxID=2218525 RepID=A0A388TEN3_9BACT|nr:hypothetical protein NO2_0134 [Candidatus Termititenax persephonae]